MSKKPNKQTVYQFQIADTDRAVGLISQFLQAHEFHLAKSKGGQDYFHRFGATDECGLEYYVDGIRLTLIVYVGNWDKPMPLDDSLVGVIPKKSYKEKLAPLLQSLNALQGEGGNAGISAFTDGAENVSGNVGGYASENACGDAAGQNNYNHANASAPYGMAHVGNTNLFQEAAQKGRGKMAIAGFCMGLVSLVLSYYGLMAWIVAILGIIFSVRGKDSPRKKLAVAGLVLSIASIVLFVITVIVSMTML